MKTDTYKGRATKLSGVGGKTSLWLLSVIRVSDGVDVEGSHVELVNNEGTVDNAVARANRKALRFRE